MAARAQATLKIENQQTDDELIRGYVEGCRKRIDLFIESEYALANVWRVQKKNVLQDLWKLPLNSLWAVPYLTLKKIGESLDKAGWPGLLEALEHFPTGLKTSLQGHFDARIATALFRVGDEPGLPMNLVRKELKKYSTGRTVVASFASTLTTLLLGRFLFGQGNLGVSGVIQNLSQTFAQDRAASSFFLGKGLGKAFYSVVRPEVSFYDTVLAALIFLLSLTVVTALLSTFYFPARSFLGLEKKKLNKMISEIEGRLLIEAHKSEKRG